jgi:hypothetical protein
VGIRTPRGGRLLPGRSRRLRRLALTAVVCLALTGCGGGFNDQTNKVYQSAAGISNRGHQVYVLNALVVTDGKGNGTMVGTLIDMAKSADTHHTVCAVDSTGKGINTKLAAPVKLAPAQAVKLQTNAAVRLTSKNLKPGYFITVTFGFSTAAPVTMAIPVLPRGTEYTSVPVGRT